MERNVVKKRLSFRGGIKKGGWAATAFLSSPSPLIVLCKGRQRPSRG